MDPVPTSETELEELSRSLRRLARALVLDQATADDLVQEAWVVSLGASPERVDDRARWLRGVVRRLAARRARRERRMRRREAAAARPEAVAGDDELVEQLSTYRFVAEVAGALPEPYRGAVRLRFFEGLALEDVAARLGRPLETVKTQTRRGLARLRRALDERRGGDRRVWALALLRVAGGEGAAPRSFAPAVFAAAACAVAVVALAALLWTRGPGPSPQPRPAEPELADAGAPAVAPAPEVAATRAPVPAPPTEPETAFDPDAPRDLRLRVVDADGRPVAGARVLVRGRGLALVRDERTDADGRLVLRPERAWLGRGEPLDPAVGELVLTARADGHAGSPDHFVSCPPGPPLELELELGAEPFTLTGVVTDADGVAVSGASLLVVERHISAQILPDGTLRMSGWESARTDAAGRFAIAGLPRSEHRVLVQAAGQPELEHAVDPGHEAELELALRLPRGGFLVGWATTEDGAPAVGARVLLVLPAALRQPHHETLTGADGFYALEAVAPGARLVVARAADDAALVDVARVEVSPGEEVIWDPVLRRRPGVRARVVDEEGTPLPDVQVHLVDLRGEERVHDIRVTDAEGRVHFDLAPPGRLQLQVFGPDYKQTDLTGAQADVEASEEEVLLTLVQEKTRTGAVTGFLLDAGGRPRERATIYAVPLTPHGLRPFPTDPRDGGFRLGGLMAGPHALVALCPGEGATLLAEVEVRSGLDIDVGTLRTPTPRPVALDGLALTPGERLVVEALCTPHGRDERFPVLESDAPGPVELALLPGEYVLERRRGSEVLETRAVSVE